MAYADAGDIKKFLDLQTDEQAAQIAQELEAAQELLDSILNRRFESGQVETRYVDYMDHGPRATVTDGRRCLRLPWDCCEIHQIVNGDGVAVSVDNYVTTPRLRTISDGKSKQPAVDTWPFYEVWLKASSSIRWTFDGDPEEAIAITGHFSFSRSAPARIKRATVRLAQIMAHQRNNPAGDQFIVTQDGTILTPADFPRDIQKLISGLRRVAV